MPGTFPQLFQIFFFLSSAVFLVQRHSRSCGDLGSSPTEPRSQGDVELGHPNNILRVQHEQQ